AEYFQARGAARRAASDFQGAAVDFARAAELRPSWAAPWSSLGHARWLLLDAAGAAPAFTAALEGVPQRADAHFGRAGAPAPPAATPTRPKSSTGRPSPSTRRSWRRGSTAGARGLPAATRP